MQLGGLCKNKKKIKLVLNKYQEKKRNQTQPTQEISLIPSEKVLHLQW
jgi:Flp pilus assembly CpaE family ATPase